MQRAAAERRRLGVAEFKAKKTAELAALVERARTEKPIRYAYVGKCVHDALPKDGIVVTELGVAVDHFALEEPSSLLAVSIGGGLGFGLGASLGAKLAAPNRTVVSTIGDGSYMFGNPTPFHLVSRAAKLPTLTIICNNGRWQAVESATRVVYPDGARGARRRNAARRAAAVAGVHEGRRGVRRLGDAASTIRPSCRARSMPR